MDESNRQGVTMIAALVGVGWALIALIYFARHRPSRRASSLLSDVMTQKHSRGWAPAYSVGKLVSRLFKTTGSSWSESTIRRIGLTLIATPVAFLFDVRFVPLAWAGLWIFPWIGRRHLLHRHHRACERDLPDFVDLLKIAVSAGFTVSHALKAVVEHSQSSDLAREFGQALEAHNRGLRLSVALSTIPERAGESTNSLVQALVDSESNGSPLSNSLDVVGGEVRRVLRRRGEERARRVPTLMLLPLVFCVLPSFILLSVAPLLVSDVRSLSTIFG